MLITPKKRKHATLTVVRSIVYTAGALGARVWGAEYRVIRAHQSSQDTVRATVDLAPIRRQNLVTLTCKYTLSEFVILGC